ncbi:hypothetical protein MGG_16865 [Pyricularia oryzae 70-15]|uniref:Uncharacterized protein n=3 Tax=Pyricularia oryzae TaxID=318829 RepID=G4N4E0_PYRO7|nr:uncharacterized protein MGG_16865 [Pyricularia oryzae 70-15]EHA52808.1 hypothetical protein MGG_16865 [Pyricularia oryzae 70-15]ELQ34108.1 hypothetical protein OOU_Y34scaffold00796g2 [Pyricularia oryzae Y34]
MPSAPTVEADSGISLREDLGFEEAPGVYLEVPNRSFSVSLRWKGSFYPEVLRRSMQIFGSGKLYAGLLIQCENDVGMASPQHSKF